MDALDIDKWKRSKARYLKRHNHNPMANYSSFNFNHFLTTLLCWSSIGTSVAVSSTLISLVLIGRAAFVFPIANIANCFKTRESTKIEFRSQVVTLLLTPTLQIERVFNTCRCPTPIHVITFNHIYSVNSYQCRRISICVCISTS